MQARLKPQRKADLARDPGGVGGGGEGGQRKRTGEDRDRDMRTGDRQTDTQTERHGKVQRQRRDRKKKKKNKDVREQERESWQKLTESNRMKTKYPESQRDTGRPRSDLERRAHRTGVVRALRPPATQQAERGTEPAPSKTFSQPKTGNQVAPPAQILA